MTTQSICGTVLRPHINGEARKMNVHSIVLYVHIVGALGLFVALGLEWTALARLRGAATAEEARGALGALAPTRVIGPLSLAAILVAGLY